MMVKRLVLYLFFMNFLFTGWAWAGSEIIRQPDGFGDIKWGQDRKTIRGLVRESTLPGSGTEDGLSYYTRRNDLMQVGDARLSSILYIFKNDRLREVMIQIDGSYNSESMLRWLIKSYGGYDHVDGTGFFWFFPSVTVLYGEDGEKALLLYLSKDEDGSGIVDSADGAKEEDSEN